MLEDNAPFDRAARQGTEETGSSEMYVAITDFEGVDQNELTFYKGDKIRVIPEPGVPVKEGWWMGDYRGRNGIFPSPLVTPVEKSIPTDHSFLELLNIPYSSLNVKEGVGGGTYGRVHLAEWNNLRVAVKKPMSSDRFNGDFLLEAIMYATMNHKNVVRFWGLSHRSVHSDGSPVNLFLVMEYAAGGDLYHVLKNDGARPDNAKRVTPKVIVDWAKQIAAGMDHVHKRNIVHRDLKPANILILESGSGDLFEKTIKIADFGFGRVFDGSAGTSKKGSPLYMAPELAEEHFLSKRSDVWSYGVVLWELLTGEDIQMEKEFQLLKHAVFPNAVILINLPNPNFSPIFELIKRCLQIIYTERPYFTKILELLEEQEVKNFSSQDNQSFQDARKRWQSEVREIREQLKKYGNVRAGNVRWKHVEDLMEVLKIAVNDRKNDVRKEDGKEEKTFERIVRNFFEQKCASRMRALAMRD